MTLVLSAISRDGMMLAADRRLTYQDGTLCTDAKNKLVIFEDSFVFGFSGLATIEGQPVDEWLARGLRAHTSVETAIHGIIDRATRVFATLPSSTPKHLAFVGVGWLRRPHIGRTPVWLCISNAWDGENNRWTESTAAQFSAYIISMRPGRRWLLCPPVGARLARRLEAGVHAKLRLFLKRKARSVLAVRALGAAINATASWNRTVGSEPTCVTLPVPRAQPDVQILMPPSPLAGLLSGPTAFDMLPRRARVRWNPPIVATPGVMGIPEVYLDANGKFTHCTVKMSVGQGFKGKLPQFGVGVTNSKQRSYMYLDSTGKPVVVEGASDSGAPST